MNVFLQCLHRILCHLNDMFPILLFKVLLQYWQISYRQASQQGSGCQRFVPASKCLTIEASCNLSNKATKPAMPCVSNNTLLLYTSSSKENPSSGSLEAISSDMIFLMTWVLLAIACFCRNKLTIAGPRSFHLPVPTLLGRYQIIYHHTVFIIKYYQELVIYHFQKGTFDRCKRSFTTHERII